MIRGATVEVGDQVAGTAVGRDRYRLAGRSATPLLLASSLSSLKPSERDRGRRTAQLRRLSRPRPPDQIPGGKGDPQRVFMIIDKMIIGIT